MVVAPEVNKAFSCFSGLVGTKIALDLSRPPVISDSEENQRKFSQSYSFPVDVIVKTFSMLIASKYSLEAVAGVSSSIFLDTLEYQVIETNNVSVQDNQKIGNYFVTPKFLASSIALAVTLCSSFMIEKWQSR